MGALESQKGIGGKTEDLYRHANGGSRRVIFHLYGPWVGGAAYFAGEGGHLQLYKSMRRNS